MSTGFGRPSSTEFEEPVALVSIAVTGAPKLAARPLASAANFCLSIWLIANSTMNRHMSRVTMSA